MIKSLLVLFFFASNAHAYTVVTTSTAAPAGTEALFIAQTTNTFSAALLTNPLIANTQSIILYGVQPSNFTIIKDSQTYSFIFGMGMLSERQQDTTNMAGGDLNCDASPYCVGLSSITAPGNYQTYGSTYTVTMDPATCQALVCRIAGDLYLQNFAPKPIILP